MTAAAALASRTRAPVIACQQINRTLAPLNVSFHLKSIHQPTCICVDTHKHSAHTVSAITAASLRPAPGALVDPNGSLKCFVLPLPQLPPLSASSSRPVHQPNAALLMVSL